MYLMLSSRPDIAFSLNQVSQFSENPKNEHWAAVKWIFAYLKGTPNHGIRFCKGDTLIGYIPTRITPEIFRLFNPHPVLFFFCTEAS